MLWYVPHFVSLTKVNNHRAKVIFARGTTEPAPIGVVAGPPLQAALKTALGSKTLSFAGVDYPASIPGFLEGGDPQGSKTMAADVR